MMLQYIFIIFTSRHDCKHNISRAAVNAYDRQDFTAGKFYIRNQIKHLFMHLFRSTTLDIYAHAFDKKKQTASAKLQAGLAL